MGTVNGESEKQGGIQRKWTNPIISRYVKYEGEKKIEAGDIVIRLSPHIKKVWDESNERLGLK